MEVEDNIAPAIQDGPTKIVTSI